MGERIVSVRAFNLFVLRTYSPAPAEFADRTVTGLRRIGKRVVFEVEPDLYIVFHLMIAGRFVWQTKPLEGRPTGKVQTAAIAFESGTLVLQEVATKKRASLHLIQGVANLNALDPGGIDPLSVGSEEFARVLQRENRTLKRILTDPRTLSGIGNAYSDEILFHAGLSPLRLTQALDGSEIERLRGAMQETLVKWRARLQEEIPGFPKPGQITAFRPDFAVHGRFGLPCPVCGSPIQRIVHGDHETNYCARCQNEGRILADRSLSRLLKDDWPRTLDELEEKG